MARKFTKQEITIFLVAVVVIVLVVVTNHMRDRVATTMKQMSRSLTPTVMQPPLSKPSEMQERLRESRILLSRELNAMKRRYGQLNCQMLALKAEKGARLVSEHGGWCYNESKSTSKDHIFDQTLVIALSEFFKGKRVASFGDGPGEYKKQIDQKATVLTYDAYDGAPFCETTSEGRVKFLDLTSPQYGLPAYDWVLSLEVAEHIPAKFESVYLDNIARHAKEGVILSWAQPGQGGLSHVNNKAFEDVKRLLSQRGFDLDAEAGKTLRGRASLPWLQTNVNVYRRNPSKPLNPADT